MMFIQEEYADDFADDFKDKNDVTVAINKSSEDKSAVYNGYHTLVDVYNQIKELVTLQDILTFCEIEQ